MPACFCVKHTGDNNAAEHEQTRVLLTIKNGKVILIRHVHDDEFVGSLSTFLFIAEKAGYDVIAPADEDEEE
ncbi:hypothetical protein U9227_23855 [Escherichia coli]